MNLELLDPFGKQVPDRVDATIQLADSLHHPPHHPLQKGHGEDTGAGGDAGTTTKNGDNNGTDGEWKAAYHAAYNRRGTYLAVGHASGVVAVHCTLNRTLAALYYPTADPTALLDAPAAAEAVPPNHGGGCASVSWTRRSRGLLAGSAGDRTVRLYDTTHPAGPEEGAVGLLSIAGLSAVGADDDGDADSTGGPSTAPSSRRSAAMTTTAATAAAAAAGGGGGDEVLPAHTLLQTQHTPFADADDRYVFVKQPRQIPTLVLKRGMEIPSLAARSNHPERGEADTHQPPPLPPSPTATTTATAKYPGVAFELPHPAAASLQIHPRHAHAGLAVLASPAPATLVLFWVSPSCYHRQTACARTETAPPCLVVPLLSGDGPNGGGVVTCAAFDPRGDRVYAVTKQGMLLGFKVTNIWRALAEASSASSSSKKVVPSCGPRFQVPLAGGKGGGSGGGGGSSGGGDGGSAAVWHLLVSRNGKFLIINSSDGAIRLYSTQNCWEQKGKAMLEKPKCVFQDVVTKVKFASCDLSGDGEYVVGGANGADSKYELYIWNTSTGALMDKLTGASTKLYSVAWHPTRSFVAVTCADGLVDIWGPRINWTAFAPDFQALPMNVEYIEREDEFDVDENGRHLAAGHDLHSSSEGNESIIVDVRTIEPVPVFASDSEDEEEVFAFGTRMKNLLSGREKITRRSGAAGDD